MTAPDPGDIFGVLKNCFKAEAPAPRDAALASLALRYACGIDAGEDVIKLGPLLLNALEALQLSPRSRAVVQKGMKSHGDSTPKPSLDDLASRRARKSRTEDLDAATS